MESKITEGNGLKMVTDELVLDVQDLKTYFFLDEGTVKAVDGVSFSMRRGETLCIVGESGCGKTVLGRTILQIVDAPGRIVSGNITYYRTAGHNDGKAPAGALRLTDLEPTSKQMRMIRGAEISMIFQEPLAALSPVHTIGTQIMEPILVHNNVSEKEARQRRSRCWDASASPSPSSALTPIPSSSAAACANGP